jgi:hypothetical protein
MVTTKVDWKTLRHAHGSAKNIPLEIKNLSADDGAKRAFALKVLEESLYRDVKWFSAGPAAIPLLVKAAKNPKIKARGRVLALTVDILTGNHLALLGWGLDMREGDLKQQFAKAPAKAAYAAFHAATGDFVTLLGDEDASVRSAAAFALGFAWESAAKHASTLRAHERSEKDPFVRASLLLALGLIDRYTNDASDGPQLLTLAGDTSVPDIVRGSAVLAHLQFAPRPLSNVELDAAMRMVKLGNVGRDQFPWCHGRADQLTTRVLEARAPSGKVQGAKLVARAAAELGPGAPLAEEWAGGALELLFPQRSELMLASELTDDQREVVVALSRRDLRAPFISYGIPEHARVRRRWLGVDPPGVLERVVPMKIKGKEQEQPLWRSLLALTPSGTERERSALYKKLAEMLAPEDYVDVYAECVLSAYGIVQPFPNRLAEVIHEAGEHAVPWSRRMIEELLADDADDTLARTPDIGNHALLPVVRELAGKPLEPRLYPLVVPSGRADVMCQVLKAVPLKQREALVVPPLERDLLESHSPRITLGIALNALEAVPTSAMRALVKRLADMLVQSTSSLDSAMAGKALAALQQH